jgi:hypothetical protein
MARPKFSVQHFVACLNTAWEGLPGPDTLRTLEGVGYVYRLPPDTEFPFEFDELWLYTRFFLLNSVAGTRTMWIEAVWLDHPTGAQVIATGPSVQVRFSATRNVQNVAMVLRPLRMPGSGRYEFRLMCQTRSWGGATGRLVSREYIRIEL